MKAVTVLAPWPHLIAIGAKPYEFRNWRLPRFMWGQKFVLHAGAPPATHTAIKTLLKRLELGDWTAGLHAETAAPYLESVLRGEITPALKCGLGTARFGYPTQTPKMPVPMPDGESMDNWAWPVSEFKAFPAPQPCNGQQGFWDYTGPGHPVGVKS